MSGGGGAERSAESGLPELQRCVSRKPTRVAIVMLPAALSTLGSTGLRSALPSNVTASAAREVEVSQASAPYPHAASFSSLTRTELLRYK